MAFLIDRRTHRKMLTAFQATRHKSLGDRSFFSALLLAVFFIGSPPVAPPASAADDLTRPLRVSPDGHFLTQPDGAPFFWLADTGWSMFMRLTREETERYLKDRADKGFNVIQAVAVGGPLDYDLSTARNRYGELPLIGEDFTRPNPKYFEHIDWVVNLAARYGIRIAMLPVWSSSQISFMRALDAPSARIYGRWIGERYRNKGIIWILGGDTMPMWGRRLSAQADFKGDAAGLDAISVIDDRPIYDAMAAGLIAGEGGDPFITYHPTNLSFSGTARPRTSLYFHDRTWLDMNMLQSSHFVDPEPHNKDIGADFSWIATYSYEPIAEEYKSKPTRPVIDGEPRFEDLRIDLGKSAVQGYWSGDDARQAAYQALFAGAAGHTYGNHSIWQYYDPAHDDRSYQIPREGVSWQVALGRESTSQMQHAKNLMLSRPYFSRIPDQSLIVGDQGQGAEHVEATRDRGGAYAMIYLPQGQSVTVDMSGLSGKLVRAWWFDPRNGTATAIPGELPTNSRQRFAPSTQGKQIDWVLVLDDVSKNFPAPGIVSNASR